MILSETNASKMKKDNKRNTSNDKTNFVMPLSSFALQKRRISSKLTHHG